MAIAKPALPTSPVVSGLFIKPPYSVILKNPSLTPPAPSDRNVDYILDINGTREEDYDPATQTTASEQFLFNLYLTIPAGGSTFKLYFGLRDYYIGYRGVVSAPVASGFLISEQHEFRADFSGCTVRIGADGKTYLETNLFKPALPIFKILFGGWFTDVATASQIELTSPWDESWIIDVVPGIDTSAILEQVIPVVVSFAAGMAVMALLTKALWRATEAVAVSGA